MSDEPYTCPAGHTSYADNAHRYCPTCTAFEADDPVLLQTLIDRTVASHKVSVSLPRVQVLRALRILQHRFAQDARTAALDASMTAAGWPSGASGGD